MLHCSPIYGGHKTEALVQGLCAGDGVQGPGQEHRLHTRGTALQGSTQPALLYVPCHRHSNPSAMQLYGRSLSCLCPGS